MSNSKETIADIIADRRRRADEIERDCAEKMKRGGMISDCYAREIIADLRAEADKLEAAAKRERKRVEADALAVGGMVEALRRRKQVGDAAVLREALDRCLHYLTGKTELVEDEILALCDVMNSAVAAGDLITAVAVERKKATAPREQAKGEK